MACTGMAYVVMAYVVIAYIVMAAIEHWIRVGRRRVRSHR